MNSTIKCPDCKGRLTFAALKEEYFCYSCFKYYSIENARGWATIERLSR